MRQACWAAITAALHVPYAPGIDSSPICVCLGLSLFFLFFQEKKRKNQRKETLTGRGMDGSRRAGHPHHPFPVFPCGAFLKEKPRKMFFAGKVSSADGWVQRASPIGFPVFALVLFSPPGKKRERKKDKESLPYGRGERAARRWSMASR